MSQQATLTYRLFSPFFPFRAASPLCCRRLPAPLGLTCVLLTFPRYAFSPNGANSARHERHELRNFLRPDSQLLCLSASVRGCFAPPQVAQPRDKSRRSLLFSIRTLKGEMERETHSRLLIFLKTIKNNNNKKVIIIMIIIIILDC